MGKTNRPSSEYRREMKDVNILDKILIQNLMVDYTHFTQTNTSYLTREANIRHAIILTQ